MFSTVSLVIFFFLAVGMCALALLLRMKVKESKGLSQKLSELYQEVQQSIEVRAAAETSLATTEQLIDELKREKEDAIIAKERERQARSEADTEVKLAEQKVQEMQLRMEDWEKTKEESLKAAKEAMFETGGDVFRKEAEAMTKKTMESFDSLMKSITSLGTRVSQQETVASQLWKSLSTPMAAGNFTEVGLENTLKSYGLESGRDFITQYSVNHESSSNKLRPDAVVFIPGGTAIIIDCKASKFFLELAEVEGTDREESTVTKLQATMKEHVRSLSSKGYREAVQSYHTATGREDEVKNILTVMYLQTESFIEKLCHMDPTFRHKTEDMGIILSGPTGLAALLTVSRLEIARQQQEVNQQKIIDEVGVLLGSVETVLNHAHRVGKGIESAANSFHKFSSSINRNLLPKARKLVGLGVELPKKKQLPANIPSYHIVSETTPMIEAEAEEVE